MTNKIKKFFRKTIIGDFVLLLTSPIDSVSMKSIQEESEKVGKKRKFTEYVFGNIILGQKS